MQIYKLSIIDKKQRWDGGKIWDSRKEYGPFIVRAKSERLARELVMKSGAYHSSNSGPDCAIQSLKNDPWGMYEYTRCLIEASGKHHVEGVAMILDSASLDSKAPE